MQLALRPGTHSGAEAPAPHLSFRAQRSEVEESWQLVFLQMETKCVDPSTLLGMTWFLAGVVFSTQARPSTVIARSEATWQSVSPARRSLACARGTQTPQGGVSLEERRRERIAPQAFPSVTTPVRALVRNDSGGFEPKRLIFCSGHFPAVPEKPRISLISNLLSHISYPVPPPSNPQSLFSVKVRVS